MVKIKLHAKPPWVCNIHINNNSFTQTIDGYENLMLLLCKRYVTLLIFDI